MDSNAAHISKQKKQKKTVRVLQTLAPSQGCKGRRYLSPRSLISRQKWQTDQNKKKGYKDDYHFIIEMNLEGKQTNASWHTSSTG